MKKYSFKFISSIAIIIFSIFFAFPSLFDFGDHLPNWWSKNKLKLGLDLQGGSQLLLQVETEEAIQEKLATQTEDIRIELAKANIQSQGLKLVNNIISVKVNENDIKKLKNIIQENNQLDFEYDKGVAKINFTEKFIREFQNSVILQSLEIIRKRSAIIKIVGPF